jgi:hypothetical protein
LKRHGGHVDVVKSFLFSLVFSLFFSLSYAQDFRQHELVEGQAHIGVISILNQSTVGRDSPIMFRFVLEDGEEVIVKINYKTSKNTRPDDAPPDWRPADYLTVIDVSDGYLVQPSEIFLEEDQMAYFYVYRNNLM